MSDGTAKPGLRDVRIAVTAATVRRQVEDQLRRAIVEGHFAPGQHLADRTLQDTFQVSRTVVREAMRQLEAEGLIETLPHRGSFVRVLTVDEARQVYAVREVLESLAAREFALKATPQELDELDRSVEAIRRYARQPGAANLLALKQEFYDVLLRGCRNGYVQRMLNQLLNQNTQLRATSLSNPDRLPRTIAELDEVARAARARDAQAASQAIVEHVRNAAAIALAILDDRAQPRRTAETA